MADPLTHDFRFEYDGKIIEGQIEFDVDGLISYEFNQPYQLGLEENRAIISFFDAVRALYRLNNSQVKLIRIKQK